MSKDTQPLPCPFCGGKAAHIEEHDEYTCPERNCPGWSVTAKLYQWNHRAIGRQDASVAALRLEIEIFDALARAALITNNDEKTRVILETLRERLAAAKGPHA